MSDERRLASIEAKLDLILDRIGLSPSVRPGRSEYEAAIQELTRGNASPLARYAERGGEIPFRD